MGHAALVQVLEHVRRRAKHAVEQSASARAAAAEDAGPGGATQIA